MSFDHPLRETAQSFLRQSERKGETLRRRGAVEVGKVYLLEDGRRMTTAHDHILYHAHQIIGPARAPQEAADASLTDTPTQRQETMTNGPERHSGGIEVKFPVGMILQMPSGRHCVVDSGLASWHNGPITGDVETRSPEH